MKGRYPQSQNGTVLLVALCFVTVLGIALASYVAVCSRAMQISKRTAQAGLSNQVAEMGLEEGLRAFNANDWDNWSSNPTNVTSGSWTVDTTYNRATRTITLGDGVLGQGLTGTIKLRVDNYDARVLPSTYSPSVTYQMNDLVGDNENGSWNWYRSIKDSNVGISTSNLSYWVSAPIPWTWSTNITYSQYDLVSYGGTWYRYISSSSGSGTIPVNGSTWYSVPSISLAWTTGTSYTKGSLVFNATTGFWYYCNTTHTSTIFATDLAAVYWALLPTPTTTTWFPSTSYSVGDYVYRTAAPGWYRCTAGHTSGASFDSTKFSAVGNAPLISWIWRPTTGYEFNDVVYVTSSGTPGWYRCTAGHTSGASFSTTNWQNALTGSMWAWDGNFTYNLNDAVYYSGQWYRCIKGPHTNQTPSSSSTYWSTSPLKTMTWDYNRIYNQYDVVLFNGRWYMSYASGAQAKNNPLTPPGSPSSYWAVAATAISTWSNSKTYTVNDMVTYTASGTTKWYRCVLGHSNQAPTNTSYWSEVYGYAYLWNASTSYAANSYVNYGGVWYRCIQANSNKTPNDSAYWTALGASVIYAEATVNLTGAAPVQTQLRATLSPAPLFPNAAGSTSTILAAVSTTSGLVDSYDASMSTMAVGGTYSTFGYNGNGSPFAGARPNLSYAAVLAASGTANPSININNTKVRGYIAANSSSATPYAPLWNKSGSAVLTGVSTGTGIDLTRVSRSPSIPQFSILPGGAADALTAAFGNSTLAKGTQLSTGSTIHIGTPGATTPSRYYYNGNLTMGGSSTNISTLNINGPVILYVNGNLIMTGTPNGVINIATTGSAEIHLAGAIQVDSGSDGIRNYSQDPKALIVISDCSATTPQYYSEGANAYYGTFYMPYTAATHGLCFNHSDTNTTTVYGAISAKKITFENNMIIHYDTNLRNSVIGGVDQPYMINEWRELTDPAEKATLP